MTVAFAGRADEVGYLVAFSAAADAEALAAYAVIETDLLTYQERLSGALKTAQDLLEA